MLVYFTSIEKKKQAHATHTNFSRFCYLGTTPEVCLTTRALQQAPGENALRQLNTSERSLALQSNQESKLLSRKFMKKMYK